MDQKQKNEELYKVALNTFFINELESDKILLALSVGAIGFYTSILMKNMLFPKLMLFVMSISLLFYGLTVLVILSVFFRNKKQLLNIITNTGEGQEDNLLLFLDKVKYWCFAIAVIASVVFIFPLVSKSLEHNKAKLIKDKENKKEVKMSDKEIILDNIPSNIKGEITQEGFSQVVTANSNSQKVVTVEKGFSSVITANSGSTTTETSSNTNNSTTNSKEK